MSNKDSKIVKQNNSADLFNLGRLHNNVIAAKQNGHQDERAIGKAMSEFINALAQTPLEITRQLNPTDKLN